MVRELDNIEISNVSDRTAQTVRAAKMHVLALGPLKDRLGDKWSRLSQLVHKLFESSIARAQGPSDSCIALDELSYALVFRDMSLADTHLICDAIANEVCQALFGNQIDEVSVRSVAAAIVVPDDIRSVEAGRAIEAHLEQSGLERIISQSVHSGSPGPVVTVPGHRLTPLLSPLDQIKSTHAILADLGLGMGFFPIWELQRKLSSSLFLLPFVGSVNHAAVSGHTMLSGLESKQIAELEIALLNAVAAYAQRLSDERKICAVGTAVSYETLSGFHSRIQYITALQKLHLLPATPLLLKIENIPVGTPAARIGELAAMLVRPNLRVTLDFQSLRAVPTFDFKLSASGIGGDFPKDVDHELAGKILRSLVDLASAQKAFVFLNRLDASDHLLLAVQNRVRFGTGAVLGTPRLTGLEAVPEFPIHVDNHP
jgi:hypothetical protein